MTEAAISICTNAGWVSATQSSQNNSSINQAARSTITKTPPAELRPASFPELTARELSEIKIIAGNDSISRESFEKHLGQKTSGDLWGALSNYAHDFGIEKGKSNNVGVVQHNFRKLYHEYKARLCAGASEKEALEHTASKMNLPPQYDKPKIFSALVSAYEDMGSDETRHNALMAAGQLWSYSRSPVIIEASAGGNFYAQELRSIYMDYNSKLDYGSASGTLDQISSQEFREKYAWEVESARMESQDIIGAGKVEEQGWLDWAGSKVSGAAGAAKDLAGSAWDSIWNTDGGEGKIELSPEEIESNREQFIELARNYLGMSKDVELNDLKKGIDGLALSQKMGLFMQANGITKGMTITEDDIQKYLQGY